MAEITGQSIVDRAETILQDTTNTRWPADELFNWLNDGQREVVMLKPDVNTTVAVVTDGSNLTADVTKQQIPPAGLMLVDVTRNTTGDEKSIRRIDRKILDDQRETWHAETPVANPKHWMFDERNPKYYYLYPAPTDASNIEIVYASAPNDVAVGNITDNWASGTGYTIGNLISEVDNDSDTYIFKCIVAGDSDDSSEPTWPAAFGAGVIDNEVVWQNVGRGIISIDDIYANALLDYVLYRAYQKDADYAANNQRALAAYESFLNSLGLRDKRESKRDPNVQPTYLSGAVKPGTTG